MQKFMTKRNLIIAGIALLIVLLLLIAVPSVYDAYFSAKVSSGVKLQSISLGGKTADEISGLLDEEIAKSKMTCVIAGEKELELDLNSAGFQIDKDKTLADIQAMGKGNFLEALKIRLLRTPVTATVISDREMFLTVMDTLLTTENLNAKTFSYTLEGKYAKITLHPDVVSYDTQQLFAQILADYPAISQAYTMQQMQAEKPTAEQILQEINVPVIDARIEKADGKTKIIPHQTGLSLDEKVLSEKLSGEEPEFLVPVTVLKPKVYTDDLSDDAFPNRLATYTTRYNEGEVSRSQNVKLAARKVNGTILNSGDIFSFNKVVGKRSYENGFKDAKIFLSDKVVDGTGGGICQVSSTIYPAVLYSDLKIVERRNHNFVVSYAKPGIDATVVYGAIDFKFQNQYQNPIKIKASASGGNMTVEIWGTKEHSNTVELSTTQLGATPRGTKYEYNEALPIGEQKVTQGGYDGLKVQTYRIVKDASGKVIRTDNLGVSNYVPLVKIIETGDLALVETGIPSETPAPSESPSPSPSTTPAGSPLPSVSPSKAPDTDAQESPTPTSTATLQPTPVATAAPTVTPSPFETPKTAEPQPDATSAPENPSEVTES